MNRTFAVIGLGKFGTKLVETLAERGVGIIAIDKKDEAVNKVKEICQTKITDAREEETLKKEIPADIDVAIVCIGENKLAAIGITALLARKIGVKEIIARADEETAWILKLVGATKIVSPEEAMAIEVANTILTPAVRRSIPLDPEHEFIAFEVGRKKDFVGKTLGELDLRSKFDITVLNVTTVIEEKKKSRKGKDEDAEQLEFTKKWTPGADYRIREGDILGIVGENTKIEEFRKKYAKEEKEEEAH